MTAVRPRRVARVVAVVLAAGLCACAGAPGAPRAPGSARATSLQAEDRVVIAEMTYVQAIAASNRLLFFATPNALGIYDHRFSIWLPPLTRIDGWPGPEVVAMTDDPGDPDAVWFVGASAAFRYRVGDDRVMRAIIGEQVTGAIAVSADDPAGGLIVQTVSGRALRVSPAGGVAPYAGGAQGGGRPTSRGLAEVYARYPALRNFERVLTQDASLRSWPLRAGAIVPNKSEVWYGSAGGGAFKVDPLFVRSESRPFGLVSAGAGAIASAITGVWIGGSGFGGGGGTRAGLTFVSHDLQQWTWADGAAGSPFPTGARVNAISAYGSAVWAATDRGLVRIDARTGTIDRRWDNATGLAGALALSVVATANGAWVGTSTGLSFTRDAAAGTQTVDTPPFTGAAVRALLRRGDTLWMGTDIGVMALAPGDAAPRRLRAADTDRRLVEPIAALASSDSIVVIATAAGAVLRMDVTSGRLLDTVSFVNSTRAGRINGIALDARTLWVAGDFGVVIVDRASRGERFVASGRDIPGEALGVVLSNDYAWIAARDGAVRFRRTTNGTIW